MPEDVLQTIKDLQLAAELIQHQLRLLGQTVEAAGSLLVKLQQQLAADKEDL